MSGKYSVTRLDTGEKFESCAAFSRAIGIPEKRAQYARETGRTSIDGIPVVFGKLRTRAVIDLISGKEWPSATDCAKDLFLTKSGVLGRIKADHPVEGTRLKHKEE